jgi:hypothetical protein
MNDIISGEHWVLGFEIVDEYYEKYILSILTKALNMKLSDAFRLKVDTGSISLMEYNDRLRVIYINLKPLLLKDLCKCLKSA